MKLYGEYQMLLRSLFDFCRERRVPRARERNAIGVIGFGNCSTRTAECGVCSGMRARQIFSNNHQIYRFLRTLGIHSFATSFRVIPSSMLILHFKIAWKWNVPHLARLERCPFTLKRPLTFAAQIGFRLSDFAEMYPCESDLRDQYTATLGSVDREDVERGSAVLQGNANLISFF